MPQTTNTSVERRTGRKLAADIDTYLHTFANLTLTGFNTSYSNHSFQEKRDGYTDRKGNKINGF